MKILAIETSTSCASIAVAVEDVVLSESDFPSEKVLSVKLIPEIGKILDIAGIDVCDIDVFVASAGPGSFTGTRAGIATAQGMALATGKGCCSFSTLSSIAMNFSFAPHPVCSMLDARKNEIYAGLYHSSAKIPEAILPETVMTPEDFLGKLMEVTSEEVIFAGEGVLRYRQAIVSKLGEKAIFPALEQNASRASNGALLALHSIKKGKIHPPHLLLPVYLRAPEAEYAKIGQQKKRQKTSDI